MKQKPASIRDVARLSGVSGTTASLALNGNPGPAESTRARVLAAAKELNYQPDPMFSQVFRRQRSGLPWKSAPTHTIGFLSLEFIIDRAQHNDGYYSRIYGGIQQAVGKHGYHLMWKAEAHDSASVPSMVAENRVDGLLIEGNFPIDLLTLLSKRLPVAFVDGSYPELDADSVMPNVERAVLEQLDYLWRLGHRNIVTFRQACPRLETDRYANAFSSFFAGRNHVLQHPQLCEPRAITLQTHARVMAEYARQIADARPRPTALISWDVYAATLLTELQGLGLRIPEDLSLMGMDDTAACLLTHPPLTSYRYPLEDLGRSAVDVLVARIEDRNRPIRYLLVNGRLIERATCAAAP